MRSQFLHQHVLDEVLLHDGEGDDADAALGEFFVGETTDDLSHNGLGLSPVAATTAFVVNAIDLHERDLGDAVVGRGEGEEATVVVLLVGERDERFVLRTVVESQIVVGQR